MSFQLHPQVKAPRLPMKSLSYDAWAYRDRPYYGWATCRNTGTRELLRERDKERQLGYQFNNGWYHKSGALYTDRYTNEQIQENIARFFWYVEGRMGWEDRTRVHTTEYPNIVQVYFSSGWVQNDTAAWLATLILRLGGNCGEGRSLEWVLSQHTYGRDTIPAIHRFLQGHQHYTGISEGWWKAFAARTWDSACAMLIHPDVVREKAYLLAEAGKFRQSSKFYWNMACKSFVLRRDPAPAVIVDYNRDVQERFPQAA